MECTRWEIFWSDETFRITGCDPTTKPTLELVLQRTHPEDRSRVQETVNRAFQEVTDLDFEHRLLLPDGSTKHVHVVGRPLRHPSGKVELVGAVMDVTAARLAFQEIQKLKDQLHEENLVLREEIDRSSRFEEIVGSSEALQHVLTQVEKVARTDSTVLILGEAGTGKELFARAIHKHSSRAAKAFIRVNCAAIPSSLIPSELFGHEKGAFTGALQRRLGRFESANGGTIFFDEIGELPGETHVALLRVLQEREFERVGSNNPVSVDVRVLAATNCHLQAAVDAGTFRRDLYYRLNVFPIHIPPLRNRADDIPLLVEYLIELYARKAGKKIRDISKKTLEIFRSYDWPGNIRELQNIIERAVILCDGETLAVDETWMSQQPIQTNEPTSPFAETVVDHAKDLLHDERAIIEAALAACRGPRGGAVRRGRSTRNSEADARFRNQSPGN